VEQRVAPVQLQLPERDPGLILERGEMRLVVRIVEGGARLGRPGEGGQPCPHPVRRQVLDGAVVFVTPGALAHLGHVKIANCPQPREQVIGHGADRIVARRMTRIGDHRGRGSV
jgi:hypothetical protein